MAPDDLSEWLTMASSSLGDVHPDEVPDSALLPLLDIVGDARVIALGESMHRTHEFLAWRHRVLRFLVDNAGVTALVLESGFPEATLVDRWVASGEGILRSALNDGLTYHFGKCQEMLDLVVWMRERGRESDTPLRLYGMDVPDSAASPLPALHAVATFLDDVDPEYAAFIRRHLIAMHAYLPEDRTGLARAAPAIHAYLALDGTTRARMSAAINGLVERMRARRTDYLDGDAPPGDVDSAIRMAEVARTTDAFLSAMTEGADRTWPPANIRDAAMADTVEWILEREARVMVFAANGHIRKTPYLAPPFVPEPLPSLGTHLSARLGRDYRAIGSAFGGGIAWLHRPGPDDPPGHSTPFVASVDALPAGSIDRRLAESAPGSLLLDLHASTSHAPLTGVTGTANGSELELGDVRESFDAILYVPRVSPWHTWIDDRGHWR